MLVIEFQNPITSMTCIEITYYDEDDKRAGVRRHMVVDFDTLSRILSVFGQHSMHVIPNCSRDELCTHRHDNYNLVGDLSNVAVDLCGAAVHIPYARPLGKNRCASSDQHIQLLMNSRGDVVNSLSALMKW